MARRPGLHGRCEGVLAEQYRPRGWFPAGAWLGFAVSGDPASHPRMTRQEARPPYPKKVLRWFGWQQSVREAFVTANTRELQFRRCSVAMTFVVKPSARNDLDNLVKAVLDALTGYAWTDDRIKIVPVIDSAAAVPAGPGLDPGAHVEVTALEHPDDGDDAGAPALPLITSSFCEAASCERMRAGEPPGCRTGLGDVRGAARWGFCKYREGTAWTS